jgi:hypothetical protein
MIYTLTTPKGRVFEFYIRSCAELYQGMYGGSLAVIEGDTLREDYASEDCDQLELL